MKQAYGDSLLSLVPIHWIFWFVQFLFSTHSSCTFPSDNSDILCRNSAVPTFLTIHSFSFSAAHAVNKVGFLWALQMGRSSQSIHTFTSTGLPGLFFPIFWALPQKWASGIKIVTSIAYFCSNPACLGFMPRKHTKFV